MLETFLQAAAPHITEVLVAVTLGVLVKAGMAVERLLDRWLNVKLEQKDKDVLHSALETGLRAALRSGFTGDTAIAMAVKHAKASVPDALGRLGPTDAVLRTLVQSKF